MNEIFKEIPFISSASNEKYKELKSLLSSPQARKKENLSVCQGVKLTRELILSGKNIKSVFFSEEARQKYKDLWEALKERAENAYIISDKLSKAVSDQKTPQGIYSVFLIEKREIKKEDISGKYIFLDSIQDPGNLGTIIRCAEAFSIKGAVLSKDCCEPFSPKVLRSSMGSVLRLPLYVCEDMGEEIEKMKSLGYTAFGAVLSDNMDDSLKKISFPERSLVVIGNEGNGIREEIRKGLSRNVYIPMKKGGAESLNAALAAGIIMWEMAKKDL